MGGARRVVPREELTLADRLSKRFSWRARSASARSGRELLGAALSFLGALLPGGEASPRATHIADLVRKQLEASVEVDEEGRPALTVRLPDRSALDRIADALGRLLAEHGSGVQATAATRDSQELNQRMGARGFEAREPLAHATLLRVRRSQGVQEQDLSSWNN